MRVRKRSQNAQNPLTAKRSLVQVNKRWPKFSKPHCTSPVTPPNMHGDSKIIMEDLDALVQRVISLESNISEMARQFESQNRVNCCALQDLQKLKCSVNNLKDEFQDYRNSNETEDDEYETEIEEDFDYVEEVKWLKERMLEISESLKVQSECLKNLKCSEMPQLKSQLDDNFISLTQSLDTLKQQRLNVETFNAHDGNELKEIKAQLECAQHQISCIKYQMKDFEKQFFENQELTCDEICSLRLELTDKIKTTLNTSAFINTQNISVEPATSGNENFECTINTSGRQENISQVVCNSITQQLCHIQKQVMSQSVCLQQLVRDVTSKVDRLEFEIYCRKNNDTMDALLQLKHDLQTANNNAAGTCMPMSCISCQTSANMIIRAKVPKLPPLKYGRENMYIKCPQEEISYCNNSCYSFKHGSRKAGGSHTKVNRCMQVRNMRFRRLKTPSCALKNINICKNEIKRKSNIFF